MEPWQQRLAENEVLYREVNERVRELNDDAALDEPVQFVCECAQLDCSERIPLSPREYEVVRANGRRFALRRGHEQLEIERVVDGNDRYVVVEKLPGRGAEAAEAADPRDQP
jgi:hypothetical protein